MTEKELKEHEKQFIKDELSVCFYKFILDLKENFKSETGSKITDKDINSVMSNILASRLNK